MAITERQLWNDYVFRAMAHQANLRGGLFTNNLIRYDTAPIFTGGDTRFRVPYVEDLDTILGADDQRLVDGTDLTIKSIDGRVSYAPIIARGDAIGQPLTEQVKMGVDALNSLSPQIATRNLNQIEKKLCSVVTGAYASGGPLGSTHVYGDGTERLSPLAVKYAQAGTMGENGGGLNTLVVHSLVEADLYANGLVNFAQAASTANPQAYNNGLIPVVGNARVVVNDTLCTLKQHTVTGDNTTDLFTTSAAHGFEAGRAVVFTGDDLPAGITAGTTYYVIATGLTATAFSVATTVGGSAVNFTDDGTGDMTVSGGQYYSYLLGPAAFYVGVQRNIDLTQYEKHLDGGKKFVRYWTLFYAPTIDGLSYTDATANPAVSALETGANWSAVGDAHDIKIIRLYNVLSTAQNS